jgi:signal transduction histidine kinase
LILLLTRQFFVDQDNLKMCRAIGPGGIPTLQPWTLARMAAPKAGTTVTGSKLPTATPAPARLRPLVVVMLGVAGLVTACRALGFGEGIILGATPASGLALAAAVVLRGPGALAAGCGFALAGLVWRLTPGETAIDAFAHGLAALAGATIMRALARRRRSETKTYEWLIFMAGIAVFTLAAAAGVLTGAAAGLLPSAPDPWTAPLFVAAFEPLGILTFCSILANLRELPDVLARPRPAFGIFALAILLLGLLWLLLALPLEQVSPSGTTLMLAVPFCLWVAMQHRSLDGGALSFAAAHAAMLIILHRTGQVDSVDYVTTILYLNLLVATCQLVHAVNLDRLGALAENAAHRTELEQRVAERTARLAAMTERALAADAAKTRFLATVSHEVRTPLNGVIGMASVMLAGDLDAEARQNVNIIHTSGLHLLDVINRILDYARLDHAPSTDDDIDFDAHDLVEEVLDEARFSHDAEGIELRLSVDPGLETRRHGYRQGVRQIATNLVGNAAKFTERGTVTVRLLPGAGDSLRLEVDDTGIGIPAEVQQRIFEPFEQVDGSISRRYGGTGLGLAICAELATRMGGRIGVLSEEGAGALFWVELPLPLAAAAPRAAIGA